MPFLYSCKSIKDENKYLSLSFKGIYNQSSISDDTTQDMNQGKSYFLLKIENKTDRTIFLPCKKNNSLVLYYPSKLIFNSNSVKERISIMDCFGCNYFMELLPSNKVTVLSNIPNVCNNLNTQEVHFFYPYSYDTVDAIVHLIDFDCKIDSCNVNLNLDFPVASKSSKKSER